MATDRLRIEIEGIVQGVGFRPFIFRLANTHSINGWVLNNSGGVIIEAEGEAGKVSAFLRDISAEAPPLAAITSVRSEKIAPEGDSGFVIRPSAGGQNRAQISPDCDVCSDCLHELFDPADRRYLYPFINCTNCGPRYSIITGIPYDRPYTTMAAFPMCDVCRAEYENPTDRRFHAQPVACPVCGPGLKLVDAQGKTVKGEPLAEALRLLRGGAILAVKGIGGYHLAVDACNDAAVSELRRRKERDEKPFALMAPDLAAIARFALFDDKEERILSGPERPIVLLPKREGHPIAPLVAPANGYFGVMLPSAPLHHLLLRDNFTALVMTSGNISDEPIVYRDDEALEQLKDIADLFLTHNREIYTRADDSVIRVFQGSPLFLRRSRGYVPRSVKLPAGQRSVLAVGGELKAVLCLTREDRAFMSQHIGDLKNAATLRSLEEAAGHLERILEIAPEVVAHDLHPDYLSSIYAAGLRGIPQVPVQHHHAHMASCMAENGLEGDTLGVVFDGIGYGLDATIWGGEFLLGDYRAFRRVGHFRQVPMPGGDAAVKEPLRMVISYLHDIYGKDLFDLPVPCLAEVAERDRNIFLRMLERGINSPLTSSCGRLFDAVAAMVDVRSRISYEGQAAIELEALAEEADTETIYPYGFASTADNLVLDMRIMLRAIIDDLKGKEPGSAIARRFHNTIARATADVCENIRATEGINRVVLSGGSFQNKLLSEGVYSGLAARGFEVFTHRLVPPNDGGLALGQAVVAGQQLR
ncbi:MAG TPA: carbamoyltransferase HypF [Geobacteraceae bacterium]|nr:carbamoyltransferase HypF [Geobacteraceae bacterium]